MVVNKFKLINNIAKKNIDNTSNELVSITNDNNEQMCINNEIVNNTVLENSNTVNDQDNTKKKSKKNQNNSINNEYSTINNQEYDQYNITGNTTNTIGTKDTTDTTNTIDTTDTTNTIGTKDITNTIDTTDITNTADTTDTTNTIDTTDTTNLIDNVITEHNSEPEDSINLLLYEETIENQFKKDNYINELNSMFNLTNQFIENMNLKKKKQREILNLNCLTKKAFLENIVEDNNQLCIRITEDLINNSEEILKQIPFDIINSLLAYYDKKSDLTDKPKKEFKLDNENIFTNNKKIEIIGNSRVLILRNIFKNIHKLYFDFFDFIHDNLELFKQSVIIDNPIVDNYKYILYDKSNVHSTSLYDIYKSWDKTLYEQYKINNINHNKSKLSQLQYLKDGFITIIICVRNNFEYLKQSLGSVISQTNNNWEVVIVNDGSVKCIYLDQIFGYDFYIVKPYLNRITIIENKEWNGVVYCQTQALDYAHTEYIGILDADDKLDVNCIEIVLDTYNKFKNNKNIFVFTNFYLTDENFNPISLGFTKKPKKSLLQDGFALAFRTFKLRDYYQTTGYNPKFRYGGEDMDLLYKLEEIAQPFYVNKPLYYYRRFDKIKKDCKNLSISKYHKYNCLMAKIINSIERFGNCFKIRIYSKIAENDIENMIYRLYSKYKKGLMYKLIDFYVELYIGFNCEVCLGHIPIGNINDIMLRPYLLEYIKTKKNEYRVYVKYSFQYNCLTIIDKPIEFSIDEHLKININNLYDKVFISINDNILNIDLDNIDADELPEYKKYILEKFYNEDNNLSFFHKLNVNYNSFHNIINLNIAIN
jgi:hypothetical protein